MSDDWLTEDPFAEADDPAAAERERRRREREERRRQRDEKRRSREASAPPPETPPPPPPQPPMSATTEEDFWEEPPPAPPPPPAGRARPAAFRSARRGAPPVPRPLAAARRHPLRVVAALAAAFVLAWFLVALFQPFHGDGTGRVVVTIPKGASVAEVGDLLGRKGVVSSSTLFQIRVTLAGKRSDLYPGRYALAHGMSYGAAIDALSTPPLKKTSR